MTDTHIYMEDEVMVIVMPEDQGINFITKSVAEISKCVKVIDFEGTQTTYVDTDRNTTNDENRQDEVAVVDENTFQGQGVSDEEDRIKDEERDETHQQYPVKDDYEIKEETRNMEILFGINQKNNKQIYGLIENREIEKVVFL